MAADEDILNDPIFVESRQAFRKLNGLPADSPRSPTHGRANRPGEPDARSGSTADPLFHTARRHRVIGLIHAASPATSTDAWMRAAYGQAQFTARCTAEAERLYALLERRLSFIALIKGPVLAQQAWSDAGLRSFDDLDFRCERSDFDALYRVLVEAGYAPKIAHARHRAHRWHYGWGAGFVHPDGFTVEANHRFFPPHYPWPRDLSPHHASCYSLQPLDARSVRAPTPAFHLLLSCLHAIWHGGERLSWMVDIAGLLVRHPTAFAQADAWVPSPHFARCALHTGCAIADRILGPNLLPRGAPEAIASAVDRYVDQLAHPDAFPPRQAEPLHRLMLNPAERIGYALRRTCIPGDGDFRWITLPEPFRFLYWGLRPLRVLMGRSRPS